MVSRADSTLGVAHRRVLCSIWRCRVADIHPIMVDEAEGSHARGGQVEGGRRAQTTAPTIMTRESNSLRWPASPISGSRI